MNPPSLTFSSDASAWAEWIPGAVLSGVLLSLAAVGCAWLLRKSHPALRSVVLAVFPAVMIGAFFVGMPLSPRAETEEPAGVFRETVTIGGWSGQETRGGGSGLEVVTLSAAESAAREAASPRLRLPLPVAWRGVILAAGGLWLAGVLGMAGLALAGRLRLRQWRREARRIGVFENLPVWESPHCPQPMCAGLFWPLILLPARLAAMPEAQVQAVLRHEAAHIRQGDLWLLQLQWAARALYWWNPLLHALNRRLSAALEERADLAVLRSGTPAADYAQCLLDCARRTLPRGASPPVLAMASPLSGVKSRITAILSETSIPAPGRVHRGAWLLGAAALAVSVPLLTPRTAFAQQQAQETEKAEDRAKATNPAPALAEPASPIAEPGSGNNPASPNPVPPVDPSPSPSQSAENQAAKAPSTPEEHAPEKAPPAAAVEAAKSTTQEEKERSLQRLLQVGEEIFGRMEKVDKSKVEGSIKCSADSILMSPDEKMTLLNNVRITFQDNVLEAERVEVIGVGKTGENGGASASFKAVGEFRLQTKIHVVTGSKASSRLEFSTGGPMKFVDATIRTKGP